MSGTKSDFYIGRGPSAEWIGSLAYDGYPQGFIKRRFRNPLVATSEDEFRTLVSAIGSWRDDFAKIENGWPWPWDDSGDTEYAYAWDDGVVWGSFFGTPWFKATEREPEYGEEDEKTVVFPNMKNRRKITCGRSPGLVLIMGGLK